MSARHDRDDEFLDHACSSASSRPGKISSEVITRTSPAGAAFDGGPVVGAERGDQRRAGYRHRLDRIARSGDAAVPDLAATMAVSSRRTGSGLRRNTASTSLNASGTGSRPWSFAHLRYNLYQLARGCMLHVRLIPVSNRLRSWGGDLL